MLVIGRLVDELVDSVYATWGLNRSTPLIATGGSMGGCSSLLYTRYAKRPVAACMAMCPVCDVKFHFSERPDLPMSMRQAFRSYGEDLHAAFEEQSPLSQVAKMPDIPYLIIHGAKDKAVSKVHHSDPMVARMRQRHMNVEYIEVPVMQHCSPVPLPVLHRQIEFVASHLRRPETKAAVKKVGGGRARR